MLLLQAAGLALDGAHGDHAGEAGGAHATVGGGWRYGWNEGPDNSASQWGAIGLVAAERYFQIPVPDWVKQQNRVWVQYSRGGQGFGYTGSGDGEVSRCA